ncbi:MAG: hypothetical protein ACK5PZ_14995, partial [Pirellula sp.]
MAPFLRPSLLFVAFRRLVDPSATPTATSPVVTSPAVARPVSDFFRISLAGLLMVTLWCVASFAEDPTPPKSIEDTKEQLKKAGQLFKDKKFGESSALVEVCTQAFVPLVLDSE